MEEGFKVGSDRPITEGPPLRTVRSVDDGSAAFAVG